MGLLLYLVGAIVIIAVIFAFPPVIFKEARQARQQGQANTFWEKSQSLLTIVLCIAALFGNWDTGILILALIAVNVVIRIVARFYEKSNENDSKGRK